MLNNRTTVFSLYSLYLIAISQVSTAFVNMPQVNTKPTVSVHKMGHPSYPHPRLDNNNKYNKNDHSKEHTKAPIYITIGPQCAGKTSFLQKLYNVEASHSENANIAKHHLHSTPVCDISIDDQTGVYLPLPKELFLADKCVNNSFHQQILSRMIHDKSIEERINDSSNDEQRYILQRLHNIITANDFAERILSMEVDANTRRNWNQLMEYTGGNDDNHRDHRYFLIEIVEKTLERHGPTCIDKVDLFIVESIFRNQDDGLLSFLSEQPNHNHMRRPQSIDESSLSGLSTAIQNLQQFACHPNKMNIPLAWGNTNTKSRDYASALDAAVMSGRPVYFIPYMDVKKKDMLESQDGLILPNVGVVSLLERNIKRLVTAGRYIPSKAIIDTSVRVDQMMNRVMRDLKTSNPSRDTKMFTQVEFDMILTRHAGDFRMNRHNRTIQRIQQKPSGRWEDGTRRGEKRYNDRNMKYRINSKTNHEKKDDYKGQGSTDRRRMNRW